jgi:predicted AlkP superfamily pyrophosphatase or phosphodiesterase
VFVYSLPQDVHVSVIAREGAASIDGGSYEGFYAPVASRVRRFDACFGAFIADLKAQGQYDRSVIVLTSDHGDSLGEEGRMGHAYTLYPEVARVPLLVHVPSAIKDRYAWDLRRAAYTTDLTPTLYRLLGQEPVSPGSFYGASLARTKSADAPAEPSRMLAASYGSVYGAVLDEGARLYVVDAIERREMLFELGAGPEPGVRVQIDPATRRAGGSLITRTVESIARSYGYAASGRR